MRTIAATLPPSTVSTALDWFWRAILKFGQATGVAASGLMVRMGDPDDRSEAMPAFSIKQLLLQRLLAGGVLTVVATLAVDG
jgi:ESS family glutamate:Na+ symporter